ncbi:hypothetical protein GmHk_20G057479 [Glycine max]|nr:hypothetical protein GmHk_20G057479 [Glycine max]
MAPKKLTAKRAQKTTTGEGSSTSPPLEYFFRSEEHQRRYQLIKDWSFLKEWRVQLAEEDFLEQLAEQLPKNDHKVILEFYANAWPTKEGVLDQHSKVWGQWIPYPMMLEEGQQCKYTSRRERAIGFDQEAIGHLLCFRGCDFVLRMMQKRLWIMRTHMTIITQI